MHKNPFWLALLILISLVAIWYSAIAFYHLYGYVTLSKTAPAEEVRWSIKENDPDSFQIVADYTFTVADKTNTGTTVFNDWSFRNPWGAQAILKEREKQTWTVWYSPWNFNHSSLQKSFPTKECLTMGVLVGLLLYFIWLGSYVARYQR